VPSAEVTKISWPNLNMSGEILENLIATGASALGLSLLLTPMMRKVAHLTGKVALPRESRWHKRPTALLGGIAIFVSCLTIWLVFGEFGSDQGVSKPLVALLLGGSAVFVLGLFDDLRGMAPQHKLAGQIVVASVMLFFGFNLRWTGLEGIDAFLSILWIVGITNAFNLLDNMDGLAAGIAFIGGAFALFQYLGLPQLSGQEYQLAILCTAYLGALLGFLVYNFNPASIFMGDAGSLYIGFTLACLCMGLVGSEAATGGFVNLLSVIAVPVFIVLVPIIDTTFVSIMRKAFGQPVSQGGRDHSSHRLVAIGFSERRAVLVLYGFAITSGVVGLTTMWLNPWVSGAVMVTYILFVIFFWIYLGKVKVYPTEVLTQKDKGGLITPILVEITYRRRLFEVMLDLVLITLAYYVSYLLRFEGNIRGPDFQVFLKTLPIVIGCQMLSFYLMGVYKGIWSTMGPRDVVGYIKAITIGTIMAVLVLLVLYRFQGISRAVFMIYWFIMVISVSLSRGSIRFLDEGIKKGDNNGIRTIVYGAGIGGQMALKEIETNKDLGLQLVGFVDDNPRLRDRTVRGYPVLGTGKDLRRIVQDMGVEQVIVSFKENGDQKKKELMEMAKELNREIKITRLKLTIE